MSNPFAQDGRDPFGELVSSIPAAPAVATNSLKPVRAAPSPPRPAATANPFGQLAPAASNSSASAQVSFDLLTGLSSNTAIAAPAASPPSYESVVASAEPPPPSYGAALDLPPPPPHESATDMPPAPLTYEDAMGWAGQQQAQQQQPQHLVPARAPPPKPAVQGPLHAGMPSRPAPARPPPAAPGAAVSPVPARVAPPPPMPARAHPPAPKAAAAAAAAHAIYPASAGDLTGDDPDWIGSTTAAGYSKASQQLPQQLAGVHISAGRGRSSLSTVYQTTGSIGAVPKSGWSTSQQVLQRELGAQIRLPPLNPKTAAPLKTLAAGLGSLFAGPAGDASQILQWSPSESGTTLPAGATPCAREDHDSGACAELTPRMQDYGSSISSKANRVTCMLVGHGPGLLWCGTLDGTVHCWSMCKEGTGTSAKWLHSWVAHSGKKIKALALSPCGRLFTGSASGALRMWNYGSPAFTDTHPPRLLRQLCKLDPRTGVSLDPHSKVVGLATSAGGRVLWSVGKNTSSLWSMHNGELLGTMVDDDALQRQQYAYGGYVATGAAASTDIGPKAGLDADRLNSLFQRPPPEMLAADDEFLEGEKDAAAIAINAAVKVGKVGVGKASKLFSKLQKNIAAKMLDDGKAGSTGSDSNNAIGSFCNTSADLPTGTAAKIAHWGSIKKLVAAADGSMWLGYKRGLLEKYSEGGQLLWSSSAAAGVCKPAGVTALAAVGSSVWVGDTQGQIWVLDAATAVLQRTWKAHVFPVRSIAAGGHLVYSLGKAGSVRAWPARPAPAALTAAWQEDMVTCLQEQQLQVLVGTWNVNETKPSRAGLQLWLADRAKSAHIVMIGLQEVEMGGTSVALDAFYQNLAKGKLEAGTQAAQAWSTAVGEVLRSVGDFRRVGLRQMSGVLALVFARAELELHIGEVSTASVACGVMGMGGNKGAVAVSFSLFRRRVVLVSSHFAAHQDKVESRNADYAKIVRHLHFHNVPTDKPQQQQQYESSEVVVTGSAESYSHKLDSACLGGGSPGMSPTRACRAGGAADGDTTVAEEEWGAGMRDAELLVWVGDFNYRVCQPDGFTPDLSDPERWPVNSQLCHYVHQKIAARQHLDLLSGDQCIREVARGAIFHSLAEGPICFMPTYKFEKGRESNTVQPFYDQGEKKRVPAWTDRVFFRGSGPQRNALQPNPAEQKSDVRVALASSEAYTSIMDVNDSDHKPVYAVLNLQLPWHQQQQQRSCSIERLWQAAGTASSSSYADSKEGPVLLLVQPQQLMLQTYCQSSLQVRNPSSTSSCMFVVQGSGAGGTLPTWLEATPSSGIIEAGGSVRVAVQGTKAQWSAGSTQCVLCILGCLEGSVASSRWPLACYGHAQQVSVALL